LTLQISLDVVVDDSTDIVLLELLFNKIQVSVVDRELYTFLPTDIVEGLTVR